MNWLQKLASPEEWLRSHGVPEEILRYSLNDNQFPRKMQKWVAVQLNKAHRSESGDGFILPATEDPEAGSPQKTIDRNIRNLIEIRDWFNHKSATERGFDINRFTLPLAAEQADIWQSEMAEERGEGHAKFYTQPDYNAEDLGNGFRMVEVVPDDLENEGAIMQHCVGDDAQDYREKVENGNSKIFSLRDRKGWPHATIEVHNQNEFDIEAFDNDPENWIHDENGDLVDIDYEAYGDRTAEWAIEQIQGKQNEPPVDKYKPFLKTWLSTHKEEFSISESDILSVTSDAELLPMIFSDPSNAETFKNIGQYLSPEGKSQILNKIIQDRGQGWSTEAVEDMITKATSIYPYGGNETISSDDSRKMRKDLLVGLLSTDFNDAIRSRAMHTLSTDLIGEAQVGRNPATREWLKGIVIEEESSPGVADAALKLLTDSMEEPSKSAPHQKSRSNYYDQYSEEILPIALNVSERFKDHPARDRLQKHIADAATRSNVDNQTIATLFERSMIGAAVSSYEIRSSLGKIEPRKFYEIWQLLSDQTRNILMREDGRPHDSGTVIYENMNEHQFALEEWAKYQQEMNRYNNNVKLNPRVQRPNIQPPAWQDRWVRGTPENDQMMEENYQSKRDRLASNWLKRVG